MTSASKKNGSLLGGNTAACHAWMTNAASTLNPAPASQILFSDTALPLAPRPSSVRLLTSGPCPEFPNDFDSWLVRCDKSLLLPSAPAWSPFVHPWGRSIRHARAAQSIRQAAYGSTRPSFLNRGHMEKVPTQGSHIASFGCAAASKVTGSSTSKIDFSCTCSSSRS